MKLATEQGIGTAKNQAQPISVQQESVLWEKGILNVESALGSRAVYYYNCKVFGLRGRDEHRNLKINQYYFGSDESGNCINFRGRACKNVTGGLNQRKVHLKDIKHYDTEKDLSAYKISALYCDNIGLSDDFYLKPLPAIFPGDIRFSSQPIGVNVLSTYINEMMKEAGYIGNFTGHSGKVTLATTLYREGVDEQLIKEQTGHRSDSVRAYKRTSADQQKHLSTCSIFDIPEQVSYMSKENNTFIDTMSKADSYRNKFPLSEVQNLEEHYNKRVETRAKKRPFTFLTKWQKFDTPATETMSQTSTSQL